MNAVQPEDEVKTNYTFHGISLLSNAATVLLYYRSAVDFPAHMKWQPKPIDHPGPPYDTALLILTLCGSLSLLVSNQRAYPARLAEFYNKPRSLKKNSGNLHKYNDIVAAVYKTIVSSTSLLALFNDINSTTQLTGAVIAILSFPGNACANLANFWEPFQQRSELIQNKTKAHYCAWYNVISYALCQLALYFNQFDASFEHAGWSNNRITKLNDPTNIAAFTAGSAFSLLFFITTIQIYQPKIYRILRTSKTQAPTENTSLTKPKYQFSPQERVTCQGLLSSFWKVGVMGLVTIGILNTYDQQTAGIAVAALLFIPNLQINLTFYSPSTKDLINKYHKTTEQYQTLRDPQANASNLCFDC